MCLCVGRWLLQVPLQVRFQGVSISHNLVQSGLLWLRLVNTSMQDTAITYNIGTGGRNSIVRQLRLASGLDTAAADAQSLLEDVDPAAFAGMVAAAGSIVPPGPCDVGSLQRSLLIVHGPSAFDMHRCVEVIGCGWHVLTCCNHHQLACMTRGVLVGEVNSAYGSTLAPATHQRCSVVRVIA